MFVLTLTKSKLIIEHVVRKCRIPKKMKLFLFIKNVTEDISKQINSNTIRRLKKVSLKLSERVKSLIDIPEMIIKLAPTH